MEGKARQGAKRFCSARKRAKRREGKERQCLSREQRWLCALLACLLACYYRAIRIHPTSWILRPDSRYLFFFLFFLDCPSSLLFFLLSLLSPFLFPFASKAQKAKDIRTHTSLPTYSTPSSQRASQASVIFTPHTLPPHPQFSTFSPSRHTFSFSFFL